MTTDLDARWAVLAAETQHDGMRDSLRRRLHEDCETLAATPPGQKGGPPPLISQGRALADAGYW
jgi:hypothetical protein